MVLHVSNLVFFFVLVRRFGDRLIGSSSCEQMYWFCYLFYHSGAGGGCGSRQFMSLRDSSRVCCLVASPFSVPDVIWRYWGLFGHCGDSPPPRRQGQTCLVGKGPSRPVSFPGLLERLLHDNPRGFFNFSFFSACFSRIHQPARRSSPCVCVHFSRWPPLIHTTYSKQLVVASTTLNIHRVWHRKPLPPKTPSVGEHCTLPTLLLAYHTREHQLIIHPSS